jgi:hypothetical protein
MYDFFLSYATSDDEPAIHGEEKSRWISVFFETLKTRLSYHLTRKAAPFLDRSELAGNAPLSSDITAALDASRLFVAVGTPTYYNRPWCEKERRHFISGLGAQPAAERRVFVAHHTCVDPANPCSWQDAFFPDVRGYPFYKERHQTRGGGHETFGYPLLNAENAAEYGKVIDSLARDMAKRIKELEKAPPPVSPATGTPVVPLRGGNPTPLGETVLLAPCAFRMRAEFEELRRALEDAEFQVVTPASPADALPDQIRHYLAFVQIISPTLLELPSDTTGATLDLQLWEAAAQASLPTRRWRSPGLDIAALLENHPRHEDFAKREVREQLFATFKKDLIDELLLLRESRRINDRSGGGKTVLVAAQGADRTAAAALEPLLNQYNLGLFITDNPVAEILSEDMNALLVFFGGAAPEWIQKHLSIVRTLPKPRRDQLPVGIYFDAPPPQLTAKPLYYSKPEFQRIRWNDPAEFQRFIQSIP